MENPLVLSIIPKDTPIHPRFVIGNQLAQVWTGEGWSNDEVDGLLFADESEIAEVVRELLLGAYEDKSVFRFVCPFQIEIRSDTPPDLEAVRWWLIRAARLYADSTFGNGPGDDSLALLSIIWFDLKKAEE